MRVLVLFIVGLLIGALGTLIAVNTLRQGTPYPNAVMAVMGQQMKALDRSVKANRCAPADLTPRLQAIRLLANDIEPAFVDMREEVQFGRYASDLRAIADASLQTPPATCTAAAATVSQLGKACDSCHRDYKN